MDLFLGEYLSIAVFFAIAIGLSLAFLLTAFVFGNQRPDSEKMTAYECGFDAFDDSRRQFDVRFYLVAILFIIFDLEVAFLFPWAVSLGGIGLFGFWSMMLFLVVLTIGFIYEWKKGALEWEGWIHHWSRRYPRAPIRTQFCALLETKSPIVVL